MNDSDLEHHLATLVAPALPPTWKSGILAAARPTSRSGPLEFVGWSAIAAGWVLIATLHLTTPRIGAPSGPTPSGAEAAEHWREIRYYADLLFTTEAPEAAPLHLDGEFIIRIHPRS